MFALATRGDNFCFHYKNFGFCVKFNNKHAGPCSIKEMIWISQFEPNLSSNAMILELLVIVSIFLNLF